MQLKKTFFFHLFLLSVTLAHADFGCHFIINKIVQQALDNPETKISFRFTCREDMDLIGVSFCVGDARKPPSYLVTIHEDSKGFPVSQALTSAAITPKAHSWASLPMDNLPLQGGRVYHLVIEQDSLRGGMHPVGIIGPDHYASVSFSDVLNAFDPRNETFDPNLNVLLYQNNKWQALDRQPLYALHGTGSRFQGDPYDEYGELAIHGNGTPNERPDDIIQGEALHPHYGFTGTGLAVRLRKVGHPTLPLNYGVFIIDYLHHKAVPSFSGEALNPDQVSTTYQWVTIGFHSKDNPKSFPPQGQCVVFQTDSGKAVSESPGCMDCYVISEVGNSGGLASAADLSFDGGAHLSREVHSSDGWSTWTDEFERDANIVILGPSQPPLSENTPGPIPTPDLWFQGLTP